MAESANEKNSQTFREDRKFVYNDDAQWEQDAIGARGDRPRVTINRLQVFARNIVNEARESPVAIKTHPVDEYGDIHLARIVDGLIRHVEHDSNASDVYTATFEDAVTGGFGYFRVATEYERRLVLPVPENQADSRSDDGQDRSVPRGSNRCRCDVGNHPHARFPG